MGLPTQCSACSYGILVCTFDTSQDPILGVAMCPQCGARAAFKLDAPSPLHKFYSAVKMMSAKSEDSLIFPDIPECGACPECGSINAVAVGQCYDDDERNWLQFDCFDCKHGFKLTGPSVREAFETMANAPSPGEPSRN